MKNDSETQKRCCYCKKVLNDTNCTTISDICDNCLADQAAEDRLAYQAAEDPRAHRAAGSAEPVLLHKKSPGRSVIPS
jgi:hypothetical protein